MSSIPGFRDGTTFPSSWGESAAQQLALGIPGLVEGGPRSVQGSVSGRPGYPQGLVGGPRYLQELVLERPGYHSLGCSCPCREMAWCLHTPCPRHLEHPIA